MFYDYNITMNMNIFLYMVSIKFEILELLRILLYKAECNVVLSVTNSRTNMKPYLLVAIGLLIDGNHIYKATCHILHG